ncbi:MAG: nitroreductase family protein [Treponema sp.]|jgi:nitroreductase|nr:nitroreductase family protein [Treponema sp.]
MKRLIFIVMFILAFVFSLAAQQVQAGIRPILEHYSTRSFIAGTVPKADLDTILQAGVRAPSARNLQPWHFTVVQNLELARKIVPQTVEGNLLIIISAAGDGLTNTREIIDCSLATQSIYLAAYALGYGSRIYTNPISAINQNLKSELGFPAGYNAIALVRIGKFDEKADAVSGASSRKALSSMINYK